MNKQVRIAIVIPCYNEQDNVPDLYREILNTDFPPRYDVLPVFVNDCSTDRTREILKGLGATHINLPVNLGIGGAVQTGYKYAFRHGFDIAVQMDGDGQHPPGELSKIVDVLIDDLADVSIGSRFLTGEGFQSSYMRRVGIHFFRRLNRFLVGVTVNDSTSGYRALNRKALEVVNEYYPDEYPEPEAIVLYTVHKLRIHEVQVNMRERQGGKSSIRAFKTIYYMMKVSLGTIFLYIRLKFNGKHLN
ncbi:MAG: glycosyltransferase family 2 protein [Bacteroidetes bacterium]|nr:glycosyltransferase family 2 protein [Bacteroidota bacterium]